VPPQADAGSDQSQYWGLPVSFAGTVSDVSPVDIAAGLNPVWGFGDGTTASGLNVSHVYANPGIYTVSLTVTDKDGGIGYDTAQVTVKKRGTTLIYTGATNVVFGLVNLSVQLSDTVDSATAQPGGRTVKFTVGGTAINATIDANGIVTTSALVMPGAYQISMSFAEDSHYLASSAQASLTVANSAGKVTDGTLQTPNNGRGGFNIQSDGTTVKGELQFQNNTVNFHAQTMTALSVSPDKKCAWFAGVGKNGKSFVAYVEDNGEPGVNDKFKLWISNVPQNGDGILTGDNIQIHK